MYGLYVVYVECISYKTVFTCWSPKFFAIKCIVSLAMPFQKTTKWRISKDASQSDSHSLQHAWNSFVLRAGLLSYPCPGLFVLVGSIIGNHPTGTQFSGFIRSSSWMLSRESGDIKIKICLYEVYVVHGLHVLYIIPNMGWWVIFSHSALCEKEWWPRPKARIPVLVHDSCRWYW